MKDAWENKIGALSNLKSELDRWDVLNPLERVRLQERIEKQHLLASLKGLATRFMVGGTSREKFDLNNGAHSGAGGGGGGGVSSSIGPYSAIFEKDGSYQYSAGRVSFISTSGGTSPSSSSSSSSSASSSSLALGTFGGDDSGAAWTPAAAMGGESPFSSSRHGRAVATQRAEAFSAMSRGEAATEMFYGGAERVPGSLVDDAVAAASSAIEGAARGAGSD